MVYIKNDMYELKKFILTSQRSVNKITVTSSYSFGFPTKFFKDNNVENYKYVVLYYDFNEKVVGFEFTNSTEEEHKFTIIRSKRGYGGAIVATSFFKTNNLDPDDYRGRYEWETQNVEGVGKLFIIKLIKRQIDPAPESVVSPG